MVKRQAEEIRAFILDKIPQHPKDIVDSAASQFSVSRTTIHRHLKTLIKNKQVIKTGTTKAATYLLFSSKNKSIPVGITPGTDEDEIWKTYFEQDFASLKENVKYICNYGFTEMLNNAIAHSQGSGVLIETKWDENAVEIEMLDDGVGIFRKIQDALGLTDPRESILQLSKGKLTTDPDNHTGEGIFFTSRAFDEFAIHANSLLYLRRNAQEDDWFMESRPDEPGKGTFITMKIAFDSKRTLEQIFRAYSNLETFKFDKTHILVTLSKFEEEKYVSRSQAKRLLVGLEKFREVVLDFKGITTVGQGFIDEVFRVFKNKHPEIELKYCNANDTVDFMIKRGLSQESK